MVGQRTSLNNLVGAKENGGHKSPTQKGHPSSEHGPKGNGMGEAFAKGIKDLQKHKGLLWEKLLPDVLRWEFQRHMQDRDWKSVH